MEWALSKCKGGTTMTMQYTIRQSDDVTILDLTGRLSLGEAVAFGPGSGLILSETVRELAKKGQRNLLLNLAGVTYVDSSGVGQLVGARTSARRQGVSLKLLRPTRQVLNLLKTAGHSFDISEDEATAVASFTRGHLQAASLSSSLWRSRIQDGPNFSRYAFNSSSSRSKQPFQPLLCASR
jgi:anti-sigma B factor antagonist